MYSLPIASPFIWTSLLKLMSFKYPPTLTNGSKKSLFPASIPDFWRITALSTAPAQRITKSELMLCLMLSLMYSTPVIFLSEKITFVTSASVMSSAPFSIAISTKSFPLHFASLGQPNEHLPQGLQSSSLMNLGILIASNPNSFAQSMNSCVPLPMCSSSIWWIPTNSSILSYSADMSIPSSLNSSSSNLTPFPAATIVDPPIQVVFNKSTLFVFFKRLS